MTRLVMPGTTTRLPLSAASMPAFATSSAVDHRNDGRHLLLALLEPGRLDELGRDRAWAERGHRDAGALQLRGGGLAEAAARRPWSPRTRPEPGSAGSRSSEATCITAPRPRSVISGRKAVVSETQRLDVDAHHAELAIRVAVHVADRGEAGVVDQHLHRQPRFRAPSPGSASTCSRSLEVGRGVLRANAVSGARARRPARAAGPRGGRPGTRCGRGRRAGARTPRRCRWRRR